MPRASKKTVEGILLEAWRKHLKLGREEVAARMSRSDSSQLGQWERGQVRPNIGSLLTALRALGIPGENERQVLARFFAGPDGRPPISREALKRMFTAMRRLNDELELLGPGR